MSALWNSPMRLPRAGFTLVEVVVVLAIMALLATAAVPLLEGSVKRAKERELRQALRSLRGAIDDYKRAADNGQIERRAGDRGYPPSLESLVQGVPLVRSLEGHKIYFLRRLPRDPFADPALPAADTWATRSSSSPPQDPQSGDDVLDVLPTARGIGLDGTRYSEW